MNTLYRYSITGILFSLLFVGFFHQVTAFTQDLGRHLLIGGIISQSLHVPKTNLLSYTYPNFPFLNHHYLSEIIFYLIEKNLGLLGLLILTTGLIILAFVLVFFYSLKKSHIIPLALVSYLMLQILFERTDLRPEIFSFLLTSIFITILYRFRKKPDRMIFLLPFLTLLWVNLHVYFFVGIIVIGLFLADSLLINRQHLKNKTVMYLFMTLLFSCLATLINPNLLQGALYPLRAFANYGYSIEENQSILFLTSLGIKKQSVFYFQIALFMLFLSLIINWKKAKPVDWLLGITFSLASMLAIRNLPLFSFAVFIPFTTNFNDTLRMLQKCLPTNLKKPIYLQISYLFLIIFLIWQCMLLGQNKLFGFSVERGATAGVDFFIRQHLKGPIFNNFDIGSYLAYRLYPEEKVFVDGRPEAYPTSFFQQIYIPMQQDENVFTQIDGKYHFNTIFFSHTDQTPWGIQFLKTIVKNAQWKIVYLDDYVIILLKNIPQNQAIIKKFSTGVDHIPLKNIDKKNTTSLLRLASFFSKVDLPDNEIFLYNKVLAIDPQNCMALNNLSLIYQQQKDLLANVYASYYLQYCK